MAPPTPAQLAYMQARLHEDRTVLVYGLHSTFMVVGMISVALRFLSRFRISAKLGKDDWLICVALVSSLSPQSLKRPLWCSKGGHARLCDVWVV